MTLVTLHEKGKTIIVDLDVDKTDRAIILLLTKGYSSAYSMWTTMKKDFKDKGIVLLMGEKDVMTYKNINKRVLKLLRLRMIEEIKPNPNAINLHGRKDYKLTMKGLLSLQDHIIAHPEDIELIVEYMSENQMDEREFTKLMNDRLTSTIYSTNRYRKAVGKDSFQLEYNKEGIITKFIDGTPSKRKKE